MANEYTFTDDNFLETVGQGVSLVDYWAPWCAPCRMQGPIIEKLADQFDGQARIGKMNVDENNQTPASLGIKAIPTMILFKDGREVERFMGLRKEEELSQALTKYLGNN
jgi:thioredoxin 1